MSQSQLMSLLASAVVEKDVENAYRAELLRLLSKRASFSSPFNCDGLLEDSPIRCLTEFKFDLDLKNKTSQAKILAQSCYYLKRFSEAGVEVPSTILVGDKNEVFALESSTLSTFLERADVDWSLPASSPSPALIRAILEDRHIAPFVWNVDSSFSLGDVVEKLRTLSSGSAIRVHATLENIQSLFDYWQKEVFTDSKMDPVDQVDTFLRCLFFPGDAYLHPSKQVLCVARKEFPIKASLYKAFFEHFDQNYSPSEIEAFYAQKDRLVEDTKRRRTGAFFTPRVWVDEAHRMISEVLGPNWRSECLVWDNSCGTANLTRDYSFKDLILTTLEEADAAVVRQQGYNEGAYISSYDFLNNLEIPASIDSKLRKCALEGRRLVFFMNPPYASAAEEHASGGGAKGNAGAKQRKKRKTGTVQTQLASDMKAKKLGNASAQLYTQFMYRCSMVAEKYANGAFLAT